MDDDEIIAAVADELNMEFDDAKTFLNDECGVYISERDWNNESIWLSGSLTMRLLKAVTQ